MRSMRWLAALLFLVALAATVVVGVEAGNICCTCGHFRATEFECATRVPHLLFSGASGLFALFYGYLTFRPRSVRWLLAAAGLYVLLAFVVFVGIDQIYLLDHLQLNDGRGG